MRRGLLLLATVTLAGCVSGDRVTLIANPDNQAVGSVVVLDQETEETVLAVLDQENQQARLRAGEPRLRQLGQADPAHAELLGALPAAPSALSLRDFPTGRFSLSEEQKESVRLHFAGLEDRPGYQIEVRGFTDSTGSVERNVEVSQGRANGVADVIRELGYSVPEEDVIGMGEFEAQRRNGDEQADSSFRRVDVVIR